MTVRRAAALLGALVLAVTGCTDGGDSAGAGDPVASPLADCTGLTEPVGEAAAGDGEPLPDLTLPCFTGGDPFQLADLRGPAIVNLWGSWCAPCREELPMLQAYADRAAGELHVLGVIHQDSRPAGAAALADDLGITFPSLEDRDGQVKAELGLRGVPATVFVDAAGQVRGVHDTTPLDEEALGELLTEHLGVSA